MGSRGIPRRRPWVPTASHGVVHGHPWASMADHVRFRWRPPKVPWDLTAVAVQLNMGSDVGTHAAVHVGCRMGCRMGYHVECLVDCHGLPCGLQ